VLSAPKFKARAPHRARMWAVIGMCIVAWFCVDDVLIPPDFGQLDIYYFKDSGINFAEGLGLRTRFTYGNPTFAYRDYAQYPPIYPFAFGVFVKAAGVSAASNQIFNSLVALLVGVLGYLALRPVIDSAVNVRYRAWTEGALAVLSIATGYFYLSYDRPDGLAVALGIGALLLAMRGATAGSAVAAGALCALALLTSPFAGIWTSLAVLIGLHASRPSPYSWLARLACVALGGAATVLLALGLLRLCLPGWFDGFFGVATGSNTHNETGGGYFLALLKGDVRTWWSGFSYASPEAYFPLLKLGAVAAALLATMMVNGRQHGARPALRLLPLLLASPLCLLTAPYQSNYPPITAALLLVAWASIEAVKPTGKGRTACIAILAAFAVNIALTAPFEMRSMLVRSSARDSLQRASAYLDSHRGALEAGGGYIAVSPTNYILWRQAGLHPLINVYSGFRFPENRGSLTILALSFPGSGNLALPQPAEYVPDDEYALVFQPALPQPATLFGRPFSRSSQTWESAIYARRP
jgi:hypothetical protein